MPHHSNVAMMTQTAIEMIADAFGRCVGQNSRLVEFVASLGCFVVVGGIALILWALVR